VEWWQEMNTVLITDSLFIFPEHEQKIKNTGFDVFRLDKPEATEEELIEAVKDKVGYILGGTEKVTEKVIDAANKLKVISFTGIGYKGFIPAWEYATKNQIAITNAPDAPTNAVAEWAVAAALMMNRGMLQLGTYGDKSFQTTKGLENQKIGIIGLGRIGSRIAEILSQFKTATISYNSLHRHEDLEKKLGVTYKDLDSVLSDSDVIFVCVEVGAGDNYLDKVKLSLIKQGALLVSFMHPGIINKDALFDILRSGKIRAISDYPMDDKFNNLPNSTWYSLKGSNAFNTETELKLTSDMVTDSFLNMLLKNDDQYWVNRNFDHETRTS
jgi:D-3-phosphoglycerate dehydrogenase / 2-oxoglutarate reductase